MRVLLNEEEKKSFHNVCKCLKEHIDNIENVLCEDEKLKPMQPSTTVNATSDYKFIYQT